MAVGSLPTHSLGMLIMYIATVLCAAHSLVALVVQQGGPMSCSIAKPLVYVLIFEEASPLLRVKGSNMTRTLTIGALGEVKIQHSRRPQG